MRKTVLSLAALTSSLFADTSITYEGSEGIGAGKHIVFLASDHEYRSEETCPALARILSKHHGFTCTVVFGVDDEGYIEAGSSQVEGLSALQDADLFFVFARFLNLPAEEMDEVIAYTERGGPVVGLRTASHAFRIPEDSPYAKYSFQSKEPGLEGGFGQQILGNTWSGHYGRNHKQGTRIQIVPEQKDHPILQGVEDNAFCYAGGYVGIPGPDFTILTETQPLLELKPDAQPDPSKPPTPSTWTHYYEAKDGSYHRVFHSTQGASEDLLDESYRRLLINGTLWALGSEEEIKPDLKIGFVGEFNPNPFSFGGYARKVKPEDLAGFDSPIMPEGGEHTPKPKKPIPRD
ncbi:MAG: hypothetical protein Q7Q71_11355 [Verrucomicrobiota bacterium JB023]|nr:hypothetical protein [Verrucomicrobiota bacterium JB023]